MGEFMKKDETALFPCTLGSTRFRSVVCAPTRATSPTDYEHARHPRPRAGVGGRRGIGPISSIGQSPRLITGLFPVRTRVGPRTLESSWPHRQSLQERSYKVSIKEHIVWLENLSVLDAEIRQLEEQLTQGPGSSRSDQVRAVET